MRPSPKAKVQKNSELAKSVGNAFVELTKPRRGVSERWDKLNELDRSDESDCEPGGKE